MTKVYRRRGIRVFAVLFAIMIVIGIACYFAHEENVFAYDTVSIRISQWGTDGQLSGNTSEFESSYTSCGFTIFLNKPVTVTSSWGCTVTSGNETATIKVEIDGYGGNSYNHDWGLMISSATGESLEGLQCYSISSYHITPTPTPEATDTPTPKPTNTPTPKPEATNTATPTPKPTTAPATATPTPKPTATNTPKPTATNTPKPTATPTPKPAVATDTPTPVPATATPTTAPVDPVVVVQTEPSEQATATPTHTPTPTPEETETPTPTPDDQIQETVVAPVIHDDPTEPSETEPEEVTNTPTPTKTLVAATTSSKKSGGFPWWILIVAGLLLLCGGRYKYLRDNKNLSRKDAAIDIIPGGVVRKITGIPYATSKTSAASAASAPNVVNGYLQTSNTRAIRPMYSNTPAARAAEAKAAETAPAPGLKAPIKRPASASVNHAAASVAAAAATTAVASRPAVRPEAKSTTTAAGTATKSEPKPPVQQRAPIKRPAQYSSNRSAAIQAEKKAVAEAAENASKAAAAAAAIAEQKAAAARAAMEAAEAARREAEEAERAIAQSAFESNAAAVPSANIKAESPVQTEQSPFAKHSDSPFGKKSSAPVEKTADKPAEKAAPKSASRPAAARTARPGVGATYNVDGLENHPQTAAQEAFLKQQSEQKLAPAIATGFVPPVIEEKVDDRPSPFKPIPPTPIKRNSGAEHGSEAIEKSAVHAASEEEHVPPIALFTPIPLKEEAASPFKPIAAEEEDKAPGLKAPIKRPASASVNRAAAMKAEEEAKKATEEKTRASRPTRPGSDNPFKPKYTPSGRTTSGAPSGSSLNRSFNTAAAMKELRAMEEAEAAAEAAEPKVVNGSSDSKKGGIPGLGKFFRNR